MIRACVSLAVAMRLSGAADGGPAPAAARPDSSRGSSPGLPDPEVARVVARMQAFYENTRDFQAKFDQTYTYKAFNRTQKSQGRVKFAKPAIMRWDYEKPSPKVFVVAKDKVFMYDPSAQVLHKSGFSTDRLSTSVTFLWGRGRLADEFDIRRATRTDLAEGVALELVPKKPDPRYQKIFFLIDSKTYAVKATLVVDADGSENRMEFSDVKINPGLKDDDLLLRPPKGTQIFEQP